MLDLVRQRYPAWESVADPAFAADVLTPRRRAAAQVAADLGPALFDAPAATVVAALERVARATPLLHGRGDLDLLTAANFQPAAYVPLLRDLLHGDGPPALRLARYLAGLARNNWPSRWALPTLLLAAGAPQAAFFVKPRLTEWFLQFVGAPIVYDARPDAASYAAICAAALALLPHLAASGARDLWDVQALLSVAHDVSRAQRGRLPRRAALDFDPLPAEEAAQAGAPATHTLRERAPDYAPAAQPVMTLHQLATACGVTPDTAAAWVRAIERKGQAILVGPPATGKTYIAQQLARYLVGGGDGIVALVQFHPAYAYEDFVQGLRPQVVDGQLRYALVPGRLLDFLARAAGRSTCVLVIDEINRADLARVLGELMYLLEYREATLPLAGGGTLHLPANVLLIGTMNTADRSIALVDHALRRRFALLTLRPDFEVLRRYHADLPLLPALIALLTEINAQIEDDYQIGPAFFLTPDLPRVLPDIWQTEIEPYLDELFFDRRERVAAWRWPQVRARLGYV